MNYKEFPNNIKNSIILLVSGWIGHIIFLYIYFSHRTEEIPEYLFIKHIAMGGLVCFFMIRAKAWAKWICIMGNVLLGLYYCQWAILLNHYNRLNFFEMFVMGLIVLIFSLSTYYLFTKESSEFFKARKAEIQKTDKTDKKE